MIGRATNRDIIRLYLSDEEIVSYYFPEFDLHTKFHSPFPFRRDPNPSLSFTYADSGSLIFNDFGFPEQEHYDSIGFVSYLYDIPYKEACQRIWNELVLKREDNFKDIEKLKKKRQEEAKKFKESDLLDYTLGEWDEQSLAYWKQYHITEEVLRKYNVHKLETLYRAGRPVWQYTEDKPKYLYLFNNETKSIKCYNPLTDSPKRNKFRSQNISHVLEGEHTLPKTGRTLVITSSLKDSMVLHSCGYHVCNPTSETIKRVVMNKIIDKFQYVYGMIYIWYDNDEVGIRSSKYISNKIRGRIKSVWLPEEYLTEFGIKDPSDFAKKYGLKGLKKMAKRLIDN